MERRRQLVEYLNPRIGGEVKSPRSEVRRLSNLLKAIIAEDFLIECRELTEPGLEMFDHPLQVHVYRLGLNVVLVSEDFHGLASFDFLPVFLVALHEGEDGPDHLPKHRPQVLSWILGIVDLYPQVGLTNPEALRYGIGGHPDIDPEPGYVSLPDVLLGIELRHIPGEGKVSTNGLANPLSIECAGEVVNNVVGNGPVVLVAEVNGRYELVSLLQNGIDEVFDPVRGDAPEVRIHHSACLNLQPLGCLEDGSEGGSLARWPPIDGYEFLLPRFNLELLRHLPGVVGGSSIGNENSGFSVMIVFCQAVGDHLDHMGDGPLVVVAGDSNQDFRRFYLLNSLGSIWPQGSVIVHKLSSICSFAFYPVISRLYPHSLTLSFSSVLGSSLIKISHSP